MGLPDPSSARTWGGKLLVDSEGAQIGTCIQIFIDDATGRPEWAAAELESGTAMVPLVDAVESGSAVRVSVRRDDVAGAPTVGDGLQLSEEEEERLYRHYGIEYSREASESVLPTGHTEPPLTPVATTASAPPAPVPETLADEVTSAPEPDLEPVSGAPARTAATARRLAPPFGLALVLGAVAAAVMRWRMRHRRPPTRAERLAAGARAASVAMGSRRERAVTAAAPWLRSSRRVSAAAAQRAAAQAMGAAQQAAALAALARARPRGGASGEQVVEPAGTEGPRGTGTPRKGMAAVRAAATFGAGYLLGSPAGRARLEQVKQWTQRPEAQQARDRVRARAGSALQAGSATLAKSRAGLSARMQRRAGDAGAPGPDGGDRAGTAGTEPESRQQGGTSGQA